MRTRGVPAPLVLFCIEKIQQKQTAGIRIACRVPPPVPRPSARWPFRRPSRLDRAPPVTSPRVTYPESPSPGFKRAFKSHVSRVTYLKHAFAKGRRRGKGAGCSPWVALPPFSPPALSLKKKAVRQCPSPWRSPKSLRLVHHDAPSLRLVHRERRRCIEGLRWRLLHHRGPSMRRPSAATQLSLSGDATGS